MWDYLEDGRDKSATRPPTIPVKRSAGRMLVLTQCVNCPHMESKLDENFQPSATICHKTKTVVDAWGIIPDNCPLPKIE